MMDTIHDLNSNLTDTDENGCEGCWHCQFAGIRWPASPDGFTDLSYVDRCDTCELYDSDEEAAKALAAQFNVRWGYAKRDEPSEIRWEPAEDDGLDYTGWSCFIDHPARDGDPAYARDGEWVRLEPLNPGEARALLAAISEYRVSFAAEFQSGEMYAQSLAKTLETLDDEIRTRLYDESEEQ